MNIEALANVATSTTELVKEKIKGDSEVKKEEIRMAGEAVKECAENVFTGMQVTKEDIDFLNAYKNSDALKAALRIIEENPDMTAEEKLNRIKEILEEEQKKEKNALKATLAKIAMVSVGVVVIALGASIAISSHKTSVSIHRIPNFLLNSAGKGVKNFW